MRRRGRRRPRQHDCNARDHGRAHACRRLRAAPLGHNPQCHTGLAVPLMPAAGARGGRGGLLARSGRRWAAAAGDASRGRQATSMSKRGFSTRCVRKSNRSGRRLDHRSRAPYSPARRVSQRRAETTPDWRPDSLWRTVEGSPAQQPVQESGGGALHDGGRRRALQDSLRNVALATHDGSVGPRLRPASARTATLPARNSDHVLSSARRLSRNVDRE